MNIHSLTSKITLIFILAFVSLLFFFVFYVNNTQKHIEKQVSGQHEKFAKYFRDNKVNPRTIEEYLGNFDFKVEKNTRFILDNGKILSKGRVHESIEYKNKYYFHVTIHRFRLLFRDFNTYQNSQLDYVGFAFVLFLLVLLYLWLLSSLKPLHILKENITKFADGDLSVNCASSKKDEIAIVSNEFDNAVQKINLLISSRQLFLRTVMHELKTPIAKGRIVSELVDDETQRDRLVFLFEKLDYLINDFAKTEEVVSNNYELKRHNYKVGLLVDNAIEMLLLDKQSDKTLRTSNSNTRIYVDFELMSMAIKNLIDNGIKYAEDFKVEIKEEENKLLVLSKGRPLNRPIEEYFKPFHNDVDMSRQGMGLGLYIVKSVLDIHNMNLEYKYINGINIFKIIY